MDDKSFYVSDKRRALLSVTLTEKDARVYCVVIHPGGFAGGHYHKKRTEKAFLVYGDATLRLQANSIPLDQGKSVVIEPFSHHLITSKNGAVLLVLTDRKWEDGDDFK